MNITDSRFSLKCLLAHPLTRGLELDDPRMTELRLQVIRDKPFLRRIYSEWYQMICGRIPAGEGRVLEIGSGAGYFAEFAPQAIQSEVFFCRNVDIVTDARQLPFRSQSLKAVAMTDVFHHIPKPEAFLEEAARCLRPGGRIVMIEPWVSQWSKLIYRYFHHEPFVPEATTWEIPERGPLSGANGALPWIIFVRDRNTLNRKFPELEIEEIVPMMPLRYLVSGGISMKNLMPAVTYDIWSALEAAVSRWNDRLGMFALFSLKRL